MGGQQAKPGMGGQQGQFPGMGYSKVNLEWEVSKVNLEWEVSKVNSLEWEVSKVNSLEWEVPARSISWNGRSASTNFRVKVKAYKAVFRVRYQGVQSGFPYQGKGVANDFSTSTENFMQQYDSKMSDQNASKLQNAISDDSATIADLKKMIEAMKLESGTKNNKIKKKQRC